MELTFDDGNTKYANTLRNKEDYKIFLESIKVTYYIMSIELLPKIQTLFSQKINFIFLCLFPAIARKQNDLSFFLTTS